jgi:hypothetical protein
MYLVDIWTNLLFFHGIFLPLFDKEIEFFFGKRKFSSLNSTNFALG